LAGHRLELLASALDQHIFSIVNNAKFVQRTLRLRQLFLQRLQRPPQSLHRHAVFQKLFGSSKTDQVAEIIMIFARLQRRNQLHLFPLRELFLRNGKNAQNVRA
jgi:hypothetical protein